MAKKKKNYYFTLDTEEAILEYVKCENPIKKNKLFNERINFALFKLTQNIINTYKFPYMDGTTEDKQQEVLCHLLEKLHMYNQEKGRAYSYFGTASLRYCINKNDKAYRKLIQSTQLDNVDDNKNILIELNNNQDNDFIFNEESYVIDSFINYIEMFIDKIFVDDWEKDICDSVIFLFKQKEDLEIFNKKAIFLYIRDRTNQPTVNITKVIKKLKQIYIRLNKQFIEYGFINPNF